MAARRQRPHLQLDGGVDAAAVAHEVVDDEDPHDAGVRSRTTRAGTPATTVIAGTSRVTTDPAATTEPLPTVTPARTVLPAPSQQSSPIDDALPRDALLLDRQLLVVEVVVLSQECDARSHQDASADLDVAGTPDKGEVADIGVVADPEPFSELSPEDVGWTDHRVPPHGAPVAEHDPAPREPHDLAALLQVQVAARRHVTCVKHPDVALAEHEALRPAHAGSQHRAARDPPAKHPAQTRQLRTAPVAQRLRVAAVLAARQHSMESFVVRFQPPWIPEEYRTMLSGATPGRAGRVPGCVRPRSPACGCGGRSPDLPHPASPAAPDWPPGGRPGRP